MSSTLEQIRAEFEPLESLGPGLRKPKGLPKMEDRGSLPGIVAAHCQQTGVWRAVEIGSWAGATARLVCDYPDNETLTLYCVDTWNGSPSDVTGRFCEVLGKDTVFRVFCRNVRDKLMKSIIPCRGESQTWAKVWPFPVSSVFIDADHDYKPCLADIEAWWPHVLPGGVICGHDWLGFPGVKQAVYEFCDRQEIHPDKVQTHLEVWWIVKP